MVDLPTPPPGLVASVEEVAQRLGIAPADITGAQRADIEAAIWDAQADVETALGRPLVAQVQTLPNMEPIPGGVLDRADGWYGLLGMFDDRVTVLGRLANGDGTFSLTVEVGLDGAQTPGVRRYVITAAKALLVGNPDLEYGKRRVISMSAGEQSLTYESTTAQPGQAGAVPSVQDLQRRYGKKAIYRSSGYNGVRRWPYFGG